MRVETAIGQTFQRVGLRRYCLRLPRKACFDQRRWFWVSAQTLFLMYLTTFASCVEVEHVETVLVRPVTN